LVQYQHRTNQTVQEPVQKNYAHTPNSTYCVDPQKTVAYSSW
jgi:hypothetical protein